MICFYTLSLETSTISGNVLLAIGVPDSFDVFFQSEHRNRSRRDVCLETRRATVVRGGVRKVAVVVMRGQVIPAAKLGVVRTQHQLVLASFLATNAVVRVRVARCQLKTKTQSPLSNAIILSPSSFKLVYWWSLAMYLKKPATAIHFRAKRF